MDTGDLIDAVRDRRAVEIQVQGSSGTETRVIHPHALYRTSHGDLRLEAIQVSGPSSRPLPGWRDFELMKIVNARVLGIEFEPTPDFNPKSPRYQHGLLASA